MTGPISASAMTAMHGTADPAFAPVRAAFARLLDSVDAPGASVCVYQHGRPVVDLWGGHHPLTGAPWTDDTVTVLFSATKAATALCAHLLAQRGELDLDAPVSRYWPEFAAQGKGQVPVSWLLSHRVGLPSPDPAFALRIEDYVDWDRMTAALARQRPWWTPGTRVYYHAITFGFLVGEVVRRVAGMSVGRFFDSEVARPPGLRMWIGLPREQERHFAPGLLPEQTSDAFWAGLPEPPSPRPGGPARDPLEVLRHLGLDPAATAAQVPWLRAQLLMPRNGVPGSEFFNSPAFRAAEIPASSGVANAKALACMYAACIGEVDGVRLLNPGAVDALRSCWTDGVPAPPSDVVRTRGVAPRLGLGFQLPTVISPMLGEGCFGHYGAGGRLGFACPELGVAFAYVSARFWPDHAQPDPRVAALVTALHESLGAPAPAQETHTP